MKKHILICDDDQDIIDILTLVLERDDYSVSSVTNSDRIWDEIKKKRPDIILMDLWVPDMGGEEATKILKSSSENKNIKIIILSASPQIAEVAYRTYADGYLPKPFDIGELKKVIE